MLTLDILDHDCLISVFMFLDVENLTNVAAVHEEQYLAAAQLVYKRKFRNDRMNLDGSITASLNRLKFFGDSTTKVSIKVPLPQTHQILRAIREYCQESLTEFTFHHDDVSSTAEDLMTIRWFFRHLDDFHQLLSLQLKYGHLHSESSRFDYLGIRMPTVTSLTKLSIVGFGGCLENNSSEFIRLNPQIEEFCLWTGYENLHSSYLKYISETLLQLRTLELRFAVYYPLDAGLISLNFDCLEKLKIVCFFNFSTSFLPFSGDTMNNLLDLDYICTRTNFQLINIAAQFTQLKRLRIGSYGLEDEHLMILAQHLQQIEYFVIADLPSKHEVKFAFTAQGIKDFLNTRRELRYLFISIIEINYNANKELISDIKQILYKTKWSVLEQSLQENQQQLVIFNVSM